MRVVIDTNIIVMSLADKSEYHLIIEQLINEKYELVISNEILFEYIEIISRKYNKNVAEYFSSFLLYSENVIKISPYYNWNLLNNDPDDNKYLDCYITGNADYLVSNDKHFKPIRNLEFPKINLLSIDEFLIQLKSL